MGRVIRFVNVCGMFYTECMSRPPIAPPKPTSSITLRLGNWLEAQGTGWGVLAVPAVVLLLLAAAVLRGWLG